MLKIGIIVGSTRPGRKADVVATWEARDRRLRTNRLASSDFEPSIRALADDLCSRFNVDFAMECGGGHKPLNPDILKEIYFIAREALTNAFRHSGASRIVSRFDYGKSDFRIECRDNEDLASANCAKRNPRVTGVSAE
jgi:signal transduction histidine kinase